MFVDEQEKLLQILEENASKLLFPKSVRHSLRVSGLRCISNLCKKYNYYINESRELKRKLMALKSWGMFYDSYYLWKRSAIVTELSIRSATQQIIGLIFDCETDDYKYMRMRHNNVNASNFNIFMNIRKIKDGYVCRCEQDCYDLSADKIANTLLPRCMITTPKNNAGKSLMGLYEEPHSLDESDMFTNIAH
jgi:hypothetical protein